jgi:hypothetical protein
MNAFRKVSLFVLVAFVAVFAVGVLSSSAEAGGCHSSGYGGSYSSYSSYGTSKPYCYGGSCYPSTYTSYYPTYNYNCVKPVSYPVTYYDCYGHPYVVWQTSYSYSPTF